MTCFLVCSLALVLLYPAGIDMYLVGLPRITADLQASEVQLHIMFSVYLAGMTTAMLFAGKIADQSDHKPVAIADALIFILASALYSFAESGTPFLIGRLIQGVSADCCYAAIFAILRNILDDRRRAKVLSLLSGITCIVPVLAPVMRHPVILKFPWQSLFYAMMGMGVAVCLLSVFVLREPHPTTFMATTEKNHTTESLVNRFSLSRLTITTLSVSVIPTFVNTSPMLPMEVMDFDRGGCAITVAMIASISMAVSFSTPFTLGVFKPRVLMLTSQMLFLCTGVVLTLAISHTVTPFGLTLIYTGFSVGFGVAMSQALGPFSLRVGVASSALGIAQVCGFSLWIWLAAVLGLGALNMLIGILIGCSIVSIMLIITVIPSRSAPTREEIPQRSRSQFIALLTTIDAGTQRH